MAYNYDKFDKSITEFVKENNIQSIAFPILGAGHLRINLPMFMSIKMDGS